MLEFQVFKIPLTNCLVILLQQVSKNLPKLCTTPAQIFKFLVKSKKQSAADNKHRQLFQGSQRSASTGRSNKLIPLEAQEVIVDLNNQLRGRKGFNGQAVRT